LNLLDIVRLVERQSASGILVVGRGESIEQSLCGLGVTRGASDFYEHLRLRGGRPLPTRLQKVVQRRLTNAEIQVFVDGLQQGIENDDLATIESGLYAASAVSELLISKIQPAVRLRQKMDQFRVTGTQRMMRHYVLSSTDPFMTATEYLRLRQLLPTRLPAEFARGDTIAVDTFFALADAFSAEGAAVQEILRSVPAHRRADLQHLFMRTQPVFDELRALRHPSFQLEPERRLAEGTAAHSLHAWFDHICDAVETADMDPLDAVQQLMVIRSAFSAIPDAVVPYETIVDDAAIEAGRTRLLRHPFDAQTLLLQRELFDTAVRQRNTLRARLSDETFRASLSSEPLRPLGLGVHVRNSAVAIAEMPTLTDLRPVLKPHVFSRFQHAVWATCRLGSALPPLDVQTVPLTPPVVHAAYEYLVEQFDSIPDIDNSQAFDLLTALSSLPRTPDLFGFHPDVPGACNELTGLQVVAAPLRQSNTSSDAEIHETSSRWLIDLMRDYGGLHWATVRWDEHSLRDLTRLQLRSASNLYLNHSRSDQSWASLVDEVDLAMTALDTLRSPGPFGFRSNDSSAAPDPLDGFDLLVAARDVMRASGEHRQRRNDSEPVLRILITSLNQSWPFSEVDNKTRTTLRTALTGTPMEALLRSHLKRVYTAVPQTAARTIPDSPDLDVRLWLSPPVGEHDDVLPEDIARVVPSNLWVLDDETILCGGRQLTSRRELGDDFRLLVRPNSRIDVEQFSALRLPHLLGVAARRHGITSGPRVRLDEVSHARKDSPFRLAVDGFYDPVLAVPTGRIAAAVSTRRSEWIESHRQSLHRLRERVDAIPETGTGARYAKGILQLGVATLIDQMDGQTLDAAGPSLIRAALDVAPAPTLMPNTATQRQLLHHLALRAFDDSVRWTQASSDFKTARRAWERPGPHSKTSPPPSPELLDARAGLTQLANDHMRMSTWLRAVETATWWADRWPSLTSIGDRLKDATADDYAQFGFAITELAARQSATFSGRVTDEAFETLQNAVSRLADPQARKYHVTGFDFS
jgi:hypothetical protein